MYEENILNRMFLFPMNIFLSPSVFQCSYLKKKDKKTIKKKKEQMTKWN